MSNRERIKYAISSGEKDLSDFSCGVFDTGCLLWSGDFQKGIQKLDNQYRVFAHLPSGVELGEADLGDGRCQRRGDPQRLRRHPEGHPLPPTQTREITKFSL